jgi:hypothetical protein
MDVKAKKKATNAHEDARSPKPATKAPAKPAPKNAEQAKDQAFHLRMAQLDAKGTLGNKNANKPRPAPKGGSAESGMGGKVAKGSKNPLRKLVSRVKRGR